MPKRDQQADWERYEKTTPGRWEIEGAGGVRMDGTRDGYNICVNGKRLNNPLFSYEDATFIATAHESWPVILKERAQLKARVQELEAENTKLKAMVEAFEICFSNKFGDIFLCRDLLRQGKQQCFCTKVANKLREALAALEGTKQDEHTS